MRLATWNINGLRARLDFLCLWLEARRPDVVGLQELKLETEDFPHDRLAELGYQAAVHGEKSWNGVAVLSRGDLRIVQAGLPGQEAFGARLLEVRTLGVRFATVYCPNGKSVDHPDFARKLAWFDDLHGYCATAWDDPAEPGMLCGDFNICPGDLDSWWGQTGMAENAGIFHTAAERARFAALLALGFHDLYRERHRDGREFSWWDYRGGAFHRGHGLRIDLLLGNPVLAQRVTDVTIDRDYRKKHNGLTASDHAPVHAEFSLGSP